MTKPSSSAHPGLTSDQSPAIFSDRLAEALGALQIQFTQDDFALIEQAIPRGSAAGDRYNREQMAVLDSERGGAG